MSDSLSPDGRDVSEELEMLFRRGLIQGWLLRSFSGLQSGTELDFEFDSESFVSGVSARFIVRVNGVTFSDNFDYRSCERNELMFEILPVVEHSVRVMIDDFGDVKSGDSVDASLN